MAVNSIFHTNNLASLKSERNLYSNLIKEAIQIHGHDVYYMDMDWENKIEVDDFLIIECYRKVDPESYTDIFDDIYLKRYVTSLIKRQWGANLSKFNGVAMLGGVTMNGETIYSQAIEEIQRLEEQIQLSFETPIDYMIG
jgi:hypothetical protein